MPFETVTTRIIPDGTNSATNMGSTWLTKPILKHTASSRTWRFHFLLVTRLPACLSTVSAVILPSHSEPAFGPENLRAGLETAVPASLFQHVPAREESYLCHRLVTRKRERLGAEFRLGR